MMRRADRRGSVSRAWVVAGLIALAGVGSGQDEASPPTFARVGILLDTSTEMGFLVPQVRKEVRAVNRLLEAKGRSSLILREMVGSSIDREASLSVPGRKNALYRFRDLYEEEKVDTVCWVTALRGVQSGAGLFALEKLVDGTGESGLPRRLVIRHIWQEQLQAGGEWILRHPDPKSDPLDLDALPGQWYRLVGEDRGILMRSWQVPPSEYRDQFGFPWRVKNAGYLRKAGYSGGTIEFEFTWANRLRKRHGLDFIGPKEEWPYRITGRTWVFDSSLVPFPREESEEMDGEVFEELSARDSIEEDLDRVEAEKLGVVFAFGYVKKDLDRLRGEGGRKSRYPAKAYIEDISRFVDETRDHQESFAGREDGPHGSRVYHTEFIELENGIREPEGTDPIALRVAQLVRKEKVDAIYLFTNGYAGGGPYGSITMDLDLLALAIREAGVRLFVRMPFETGPAPVELWRLALASGGGVFFGKEGDDDWKMETPSPRWPVIPDESP